jgi:hypothetical protein
MSVASLELCRELYELSGWADVNTPVTDWPSGDRYPEYDLGYLLRKLPDSMHSLTYEVTYRLQMKKVDFGYFFEYSNHAWFRDHKSVFSRRGYDVSDESLAYGIKPVYADSPEDAAAKLCISLFEHGILKKVS